MRRQSPPRLQQRRAQRGVVAIMFALLLTVLLGFAGLALDGGRLYVNMTELQNAADACALAAAQELPSSGDTTPLVRQRARDAGLRVATRNRTDFQRDALAKDDVTVEFSKKAVDAAWLPADGAPDDVRFVRCKVAPPPLALWLMPVSGTNSASVAAQAAATRDLSGKNCAALSPDKCNDVASLVM